MSFGISFLLHSRRVLESGRAQFVVASKQHPASLDERPFKRRFLTAVFNRVLNVAVGYPGSDTHGLKSVNTPLAKELCEKALSTDETFQTEIVMLAWRLGYSIGELPVHIEETRPTPVPILKRLPALLQLIRQLRQSVGRFPVTDCRRPVRFWADSCG